MEVRKFEEFIGQKLKSFREVKSTGDSYTTELIFELENGKSYIFYHSQDCCEFVYVEDINGDINSIIGEEILKFEERTQNDENACESGTWTFYDIETLTKHIQIRWYGESNGYYSESVDFCEYKEMN